MTQEAGSLERLLLAAGDAFETLIRHLQPPAFADYLDQFGVRLPDGFVTSALAGGPLAELEAAIGRITPLLDPLRNAIEAADSPVAAAATVAAGVAVASEIAATGAALRQIGTSLTGAATGLADPDARAMLEDLARELPRRVVERMMLERLADVSPQAVALLALTGLAEDQVEPGDVDDPLRPPFILRRLRLDRLSALLSNPRGYLGDILQWGNAAFDGDLLFSRLERYIERRGGAVRRIGPEDVEPADPPALDVGWLRLQADPSLTPPGLAAVVGYAVEDDVDYEVSIGSSRWTAYLTSTSRFEAGLHASYSTDGRLQVSALGTPVIVARAGLRINGSDKSPVTVLSLAGGTRLEASRIDMSASLSGLNSEPFLRAETENLTCVFDVGGGDSFLSSLAGGGGRGRSDISLDASWSPTSGFKFTGSAALELAIPTHARIGPATIETIYLVGRFAGDDINLEISAGLRGELGPFTAVVDRIGVMFDATFPEDGGNLGPMQLDVGFKPPSGLGLSISGGGFSGGGFLKRDPANGEYSGALELSFQQVIQVKAFGVLNTRMPDGSEDFSLAVVVSAEFTPIQLSFGFTLMGVGGLLGVNRTALYDQLRLGLRDGSMESILFPRDLVANAPRIINDLKRMFPPLKDRFLIGPMAKLGWGTPPLVTLDIGLILEIPRPGFAVLGILRLAVPAKDVAILDLQVNFLGVVDFERKEISFDASLFDSRLLAFTLTGDMAVRIYWGDNANFLLTVGGFHPDYKPPPLDLPALNRLAISMWAGNPRLSAEAYFAITSNTVQFGAKVELYYGVKVFNVYGFIALDALIQFDPFHFVVTIAGQVAVRSGGSTLFSIRLDLLLEGPTPWHAKGRGSFEIGFIITVTISANFEVTFGQARNTSLPPVKPRSLIEEALAADAAWRVLAPRPQHVAMRELPEGSGLVVLPMGGLIVSQKAAPLNLPLDHVGARRIDGANRFSIVDVSLGAGSGPPATVSVQEQFAAAQYLDLSDAEKLSRRSFEPFDAGVEIAGGAAPRADAQTHVDVAYEVIYVRKPRRSVLFRLRDTILDLLVAGSAAGRSKLSAERSVPTGLGTPKVSIPIEEFIVAWIDDLAPHGTAKLSSQSAALSALKDAVANDAQLTGRLQVVSVYEAAA